MRSAATFECLYKSGSRPGSAEDPVGWWLGVWSWSRALYLAGNQGPAPRAGHKGELLSAVTLTGARGWVSPRSWAPGGFFFNFTRVKHSSGKAITIDPAGGGASADASFQDTWTRSSACMRNLLTHLVAEPFDAGGHWRDQCKYASGEAWSLVGCAWLFYAVMCSDSVWGPAGKMANLSSAEGGQRACFWVWGGQSLRPRRLHAHGEKRQRSWSHGPN